MIIGCVGFVLNVISITLLHEHDHDIDVAANADPLTLSETPSSIEIPASSHRSHRHANAGESVQKKPGMDLGIMGVLIHIVGDAVNNIGVVIAGAVIWKTTSDARFYADPAVSVVIAIMIVASSIPLGSLYVARMSTRFN